MNSHRMSKTKKMQINASDKLKNLILTHYPYLGLAVELQSYFCAKPVDVIYIIGRTFSKL